MKHYISNLRASVEEANERRDAEVRKYRAVPRVLCDKPLTDQIAALWASLPPAQRGRPFTMEELTARLQGRYSARPHPMNVGQALRALGWTQRRDWTRDGGGRRYWYPDQE